MAQNRDLPPWSCSGCGRRWSGLSEAHCKGCHAHFSTVPVSDYHHVTGGPCQDPATVTKKDGEPRYRAVTTPNGVLWKTADRRPDGIEHGKGAA